VVLGVVAHGSVAGVLPGHGSLFVIVVLVLMVVGALLAAGRSAGRRIGRRGWSFPLEDAAGAVALVVGQALVHWLILPAAPQAGVVAGVAGHSHGRAGPGAVVPFHAGTATSLGMLAVHAVAGLLVALALRWVESAILGLIQVLHLVREPLTACLGLLGSTVRVIPALSTPESGLRSWSWGVGDARPRLRVTLQPLERRGPPTGRWIPHVLPT
jgi:hypothetical protein